MSRSFGAILFYGAANLNLPNASVGTAAGQYSWIRNAAGDVSLNNTAGAASVQFWAALADIKRPFFNFPADFANATASTGVVPTSNELRELFGTAAGGPGNPFGGGMTAGQFGTQPIPWGMAVIDIFAVYSVQTAALSAATLGLYRNTFVEATANNLQAVVAATTIALTTTANATTCHVQKVALAQPLAFEINDTSDLVIELVIGAAATSAVRLYGVGAHVAYKL